jgi:hypothetical protein
MDQAKFDKFIADLGYTVDDLFAERNRYYQKRNRATGIGNEPASFNNEPASVDYVEGNQPDNIPY